MSIKLGKQASVLAVEFSLFCKRSVRFPTSDLVWPGFSKMNYSIFTVAITTDFAQSNMNRRI